MCLWCWLDLRASRDCSCGGPEVEEVNKGTDGGRDASILQGSFRRWPVPCLSDPCHQILLSLRAFQNKPDSKDFP